MKLFQRLLVAPAALGLMAPVAANADTAFTSTTSLSVIPPSETVPTVKAAEPEKDVVEENALSALTAMGAIRPNAAGATSKR